MAGSAEQAHPVWSGTKPRFVLYDRSRQQASAAEQHFRRGDRAVEAARRRIRSRGGTPRRAARRAYAAGGRGLLPRREDYEDLLRVSSRRTSISPIRPGPQRPAPRRGGAEAGGLEETVRRYLDESRARSKRPGRGYLGGVQAAPGAVDHRRRRARRSLTRTSPASSTQARFPRPARDRSMGNSPRDLYCTGAGRRGGEDSRRRRSRAFARA